jgi:hypothetical protein
MIVVEGFDMSGKSTLAKAIGQAKGWPVLHTGGPTTDLQDVIACLHRSRVRMTEPCVQDRITHVSESVYSMTEFPKKAGWAIAHLHEIAVPVCVIYCRPPTEFLMDALREEHVAKAHDTCDILDRIRRDAYEMIHYYDTIMEVVKQRNRIVVYDRTQGRHAFESTVRTAAEWHKQ